MGDTSSTFLAKPLSLMAVFPWIILVVAAYFIGSLSTEVRYLKSGYDAKVVAGKVGDDNTAGGSRNLLCNLFGNNKPSPVVSPTPAPTNVDPVSNQDHVRGDRGARIALIEYSDLECPFCKQFHKTAQKVVDEYDGQVMLVYRHFPLDNLHPKADKEAEAAECAGEIGSQVLGGFVPGMQAGTEADKFWAMVDKIYEVTPSNNGLNLEDLPKLAKEVGIDQNKFQECLDGGKFGQHVEDDYQSGIRAGVTGTPGNILLDTKTGKTRVIPGAVPFEQVKVAIDAMLAS